MPVSGPEFAPGSTGKARASGGNVPSAQSLRPLTPAEVLEILRLCDVTAAPLQAKHRNDCSWNGSRSQKETVPEGQGHRTGL